MLAYYKLFAVMSLCVLYFQMLKDMFMVCQVKSQSLIKLKPFIKRIRLYVYCSLFYQYVLKAALTVQLHYSTAVYTFRCTAITCLSLKYRVWLTFVISWIIWFTTTWRHLTTKEYHVPTIKAERINLYSISTSEHHRIGGVAQCVARLTRDRCIPVSHEFEPHQKKTVLPWARNFTLIAEY